MTTPISRPPIPSGVTDQGSLTTAVPVTPVSVPPVTNSPSNTPADIDIYDPNLTAEQLATLSPEDLEIRNEVLDTVRRRGLSTDPVDDGEIVVSANRQPRNFGDWRVRLSLAPGSKYLYKAEDAGILEPLKSTNGVIFPYTPQISVNYTANYNATDLVHSNFKVFQYNNSSVDTVNIVCDFTAQDTREARYLLAVIHFFRTATKMFFGKDSNPIAGTPPPLCFLRGMGEYQFSDHPLVITNFNYTLPNDVDYIDTVGSGRNSVVEAAPRTWISSRIPSGRLPEIIREGGTRAEPRFETLNVQTDQPPTYVPSKITLNISCLPVVSRASMADIYSTEKYATGSIYRQSGGSFW